MIIIFTDGSSKGNPGPGGYGAIIAYDNIVKEIGGGEAHTTNNKMELTACIKALETVSAGTEVTLYSDATYVVKGITEWIHGWHRNNWKTAGKKPVENKDLWMQLYAVSQGKDIQWKLVAGHAGVPANERCDEIATSFADGIAPDLYDGPSTNYKVSLRGN